MSDGQTTTVGVRFTTEALARIDAIAARMSAAASGARIGRSDVVRACVDEALDTLEGRYGIAEKGGGSVRKPKK